MGRTKAYERNQALEAAMMLFWVQGYTATSVQKLLDAMGISRSSMYAGLGVSAISLWKRWPASTVYFCSVR